MVIFVKKQEIVDEIKEGRLLSVYQKQSDKNAVEIAFRLARITESTSISSVEKSLLRREAEGFIKLLQIYLNRYGRRATRRQQG